MASRIIHLALAQLLDGDLPAGTDRNRFALGSVLPDALEDKAAHFNRYTHGETRKTHDLTRFRALYGDRLCTDGLVLGYYLHLLQDILFRYEMYEIVGFDSTPEANVEQLHRDYRLTNRYIIDRYGLTAAPSLPAGVEDEPLLRAFPFRLDEFLSQMRGDFTGTERGSTVFFTEQIADEYIALSLRHCRAELRALVTGGEHFDEERFAWKRHRFH